MHILGNPHIQTINTAEGCKYKSSDLMAFILMFLITLNFFKFQVPFKKNQWEWISIYVRI